MLQITNIRQGAVLNHNHGVEDNKGLTVLFEGISDFPGPVTLNGVPARRDGRRFMGEVTLTQQFNTVTAESVSAYGNFSQSIVVVWDKNSFKRVNFYIDDHSFFWTDLAKERPQRAFDHFYLKKLKEIHERTGLKVTLNCFFHNDHFDCDITQVPDIWKGEFVDNSDWLKLSFHSLGEFPDRLYIEASEEEFARDYDMVHEQIVRIAGEESFITPNVIHWGIISPACVKVLKDRGVKCYSSAFRPRLMGGPSAIERAVGAKSNTTANSQHSAAYNRDRQLAGDFGFGFEEHFSTIEEVSYMEQHQVMYNPHLDMTFFRCCCCCNLVPLDVIPGRLENSLAGSALSGNEAFCLASHEQYSFPYYHNYIPDHMERLSKSIEVMIEAGCKPVFFSDGFLGNEAWGK
jgi:hypothetical protein